MLYGAVGPVLQHLRRGDYTILYRRLLLDKLVDVLNRPRISRKYKPDQNDIKTALALILLRGETVTPTRSIAACCDPKDNKFLEVAVAGKADVRVSGDEDLVTVQPLPHHGAAPGLVPAHRGLCYWGTIARLFTTT